MEDLKIKPSQKAELPLLLTFSKIGDVESANRTAAMLSAVGCEPDVIVNNFVLSAYVNYPGVTMWEEINTYYKENYGEEPLMANLYTYQWLFRACVKYNKPDAAIAWFNEALDLKVGTVLLKEQLQSTVGDARFDEYWNNVSPERQALLLAVEDSTDKEDASEMGESDMSEIISEALHPVVTTTTPRTSTRASNSAEDAVTSPTSDSAPPIQGTAGTDASATDPEDSDSTGTLSSPYICRCCRQCEYVYLHTRQHMITSHTLTILLHYFFT